jgi:methylmalonyl-CoA mutase N-terminal domain/subunit
VAAVRAGRDGASWRRAIDAVEAAARGGSNLVPTVLAAVRARATLGEIADALRRAFGEYRDINT